MKSYFDTSDTTKDNTYYFDTTDTKKNDTYYNITDTTKNDTYILDTTSTNIGGPPMPVYQGCSSMSMSMTNLSPLTKSQKQQAFETSVQTTGYNLFDLTKITNASLDTTKLIVNNTSFYVFFSLFLIFTILILVLMFYNAIDNVVGIYLIVLFSIIIYVMSVFYRFHTISQAISSTNVVNQDIVVNQAQYENSIAMQPQMMLDVISTIN